MSKITSKRCMYILTPFIRKALEVGYDVPRYLRIIVANIDGDEYARASMSHGILIDRYMNRHDYDLYDTLQHELVHVLQEANNYPIDHGWSFYEIANNLGMELDGYTSSSISFPIFLFFVPIMMAIIFVFVNVLS